MSEISFLVQGRPAGSGSKVAFKTPQGKMIVAPASKFQKPWQEAVKWAFTQSPYGQTVYGRRVLLTGPLKVSITFIFIRPQSHFGSGANADKLKKSAPQHPFHRPDLDKLIRSTGDALTGLIWRDDSQIVELTATKVFGDKTGALVRVEEL
ncbi:MAG: RusA family crossover junction endodeoxyribonuclease [Candidatus Thermoplasmatota archaeon]|nr:RusA family crossover junction endodeoxyribonuclease [Candidatus Thermoplasmatota archaeon]